MALKVGIVGLPNVGKSTLFNALTRTAAAQAANFPFCTIEPNVGEVAVPDPRLDRLAGDRESRQGDPGAHHLRRHRRAWCAAPRKGEGLGNQFLANIRECDAVAHVLRCFEDPDVTHVEGRVDPLADAETVETELMLADLESVERRLAGLARKLKGGDKEAAEQARLLEAARRSSPRAGRRGPWRSPTEDARAWRMLQLLTAKPVLYVCNVEEAAAATGNAGSAAVAAMAAPRGRRLGGDLGRDRGGDRPARRRRARRVPGRARPRGGRARPDDPRGLPAARPRDLLHRRAEGGARLDDPAGASAPEAAGVIHGDFERGFIRAETVAYDDYVALGGEAGAREAGKLRAEGKAYRVQDGDVLHFLFNA